MNFIWRVILAAAIILGACSTPTVASEKSLVVSASSKTQMIGVTATGPRADLDRLQAVVTKSGFPSEQMDSPDGWELFVLFPPGSDASAVAAFLDRLRGGEFSTLEFRSVDAPVSP